MGIDAERGGAARPNHRDVVPNTLNAAPDTVNTVQGAVQEALDALFAKLGSVNPDARLVDFISTLPPSLVHEALQVGPTSCTAHAKCRPGLSLATCRLSLATCRISLAPR